MFSSENGDLTTLSGVVQLLNKVNTAGGWYAALRKIREANGNELPLGWEPEIVSMARKTFPGWGLTFGTRMFYIIEDYTVLSIWDDFILRQVPKLPTKPIGWTRPEARQPEGDWTLASGWHQMASESAYYKAGFAAPKFDEIPAVVCMYPDGHGEIITNVTTARAAAAFVGERIK